MTEFEKKLWKLLCMTETGGGGGGQPGEEYGVEWDYSNPSPALTRTGDASGFANPVPATSLTATGSSPFDNIMPWAGMRMCNIIGGEVVYWQGDPQFSETDYDTMVYIPEFWYRAEKDTENHTWRWSISPTEKDGYARHPGSGRYIGRYHDSGSGASVASKSGVTPRGNTTRADFRTYSHNKGAGWWMLDLATWSAVQMLYLVEYADFNSQDRLGEGQTSGSIKPTGSTDGAVYHTVKRTRASNQYRWVEDPFSNVRTLVDGFLAVDRAVYVGIDNATFGDSTSDLDDAGITLPSSNYISGFGRSVVCPWAFIPDAADGSESTYVPDWLSSSAGICTLCIGGRYSSDAKFGMFNFWAHDSLSSINAGIGSRLIFIP